MPGECDYHTLATTSSLKRRQYLNYTTSAASYVRRESLLTAGWTRSSVAHFGTGSRTRAWEEDEFKINVHLRKQVVELKKKEADRGHPDLIHHKWPIRSPDSPRTSPPEAPVADLGSRFIRLLASKLPTLYPSAIWPFHSQLRPRCVVVMAVFVAVFIIMCYKG